MLAILEPHLASPFAYALVFVLGAVFGSFANVCIYRMPPTDEHPDGRSVVSPGSHCFACGVPVAWYDNIPILSFAWLRGRCRACKAEFSPRYLFVEAATAMLFVAVYLLSLQGAHGESLALQLARFAIDAAFVFVLVVIAFIDLDTTLILDKLTRRSIPVFYLASLILPENTWFDGIVGAIVGYGIVWVVAKGYKRLRGREGMGMGDGKLLALVGALLGWKAVVFSLFAGSVIGVAISVPALLLARRREAGSESAGASDQSEYLGHAEIPFGPSLAAAALIYLFVEPWLAIQLRQFA